jgi:BON domain
MPGVDERWDERDDWGRGPRERAERDYARPPRSWERRERSGEPVARAGPIRGQTGFDSGAYAAAEREGYDMPEFRAFAADANRPTPGPYSGIGPRNYRRSDERIREDVCERLTEHGQIDASDIEVTVSDGEVTLGGSVADRGQKRLAEDMADDVAGVRDVHNRLQVRRPGGAAQPVAREDAAAP